MKKIVSLITCLLIATIIYCQSLDTIRVRNLALRRDEWYWCKAHWNPTNTTEKAAWKRMKAAFVLANPQSNNTMVTIDSIPGSVAIQFYAIFLRDTKGETGQMGNNISTNIKAYAPMLFFTSIIDADYLIRFQNSKDNGKDDFDN